MLGAAAQYGRSGQPLGARMLGVPWSEKEAFGRCGMWALTWPIEIVPRNQVSVVKGLQSRFLLLQPREARNMEGAEVVVLRSLELWELTTCGQLVGRL